METLTYYLVFSTDQAGYHCALSVYATRKAAAAEVRRLVATGSDLGYQVCPFVATVGPAAAAKWRGEQ